MVAVVLSGTFLVMLNQQLLSPALPAVMADLQVSATTVQWLQSAYALIIALLVPLSAFFLGRFSTRRLFLGALGVFLCGSLVCAFAGAFPMVLAGRMLQACAAGVLNPMCITILMLSFPKERRGTAMGVTSLVMSIAPILGPALSGAFVDRFQWRAVFVLSGALAAVIFAVGLLVLKNFEGFQKSVFDAPSVALSSLGLLGILYGLSTFSEPEKRIPAVGLILAGMVILAFFARRQRGLDTPLLDVGTLAVRQFRVSALAPAFMQAVMYGATILLPIYLQTVLGESATVSGLVMMPGAALGALAAYLSGRLFDRYGVRVLAVSGSVLFMLSGFGFAALPEDGRAWMAAAVYTVMIVSVQLIVSPLKTWGLNSLDNPRIPHGIPIQNTFVSVGGSLGTAAVVSIGALAGSRYQQAHLGFLCMAVFAVLYTAVIVGFVRDGK